MTTNPPATPLGKTVAMGDKDSTGLRGKVLGGTYELIEPLGMGGMGVVCKARHVRLGKELAIKMLLPQYASDPDTIERFRREAQAAGTIEHEGIVDILDVNSEPDGTYYIAMELLRGEDLDHLNSRVGPLPVQRSVEIAKKICLALNAAHERGIVHRDIKPANIFLVNSTEDESHVKLLDFGVSKLLENASRVTGTGFIIGTPLYMSPEQACGDPSIDQRADIFSTGIVLYEMLTGHTPFEAATPVAILARIMNDTSPPMSSLNKNIPDWCDAITAKCLLRNPDSRFQSTLEIVRALDCGNTKKVPASLPPKPVVLPEKELRIVTIAFITISHSEHANQVLAPDESSELILPAIIKAKEIIEQHGGTVQRYLGDGLLAVFGAPIAHGDDAARALRAALDIRKLIDLGDDKDHPLTVRSGVTTGRVVTGRLRGFGESGYGVVGNAVGLARKIEGIGGDASVIACAETYSHVRGRFKVRRLETSAVSSDFAGKSAYEILEENPHGLIVAPRKILGARSPMAGRAVELGQLLGMFEQVVDEGMPLSVEVIGAPGIGKSRLASEFLLRIDDLEEEVFVLAGSARQLMTGTPLALWSNVIRGKSGVHSDETAEEGIEKVKLLAEYMAGSADDLMNKAQRVLSLLLELRDPEQSEDALMDQLVDVFGALLAATCVRYPVVILLDDVQWADGPSMDLTMRLFERLQAHQVFFILLARPEFTETSPKYFSKCASHLRIKIRNLSKRDGQRLVRGILGSNAPNELISKITERSGGTPLFIEEILYGLMDRGVFRREGTKWKIEGSVDTLELPLTVEAVIQSRLDRLTSVQRNLLGKAAVVGEHFWDGVLIALGSRGIVETIAECIALGFIRACPISRFAGFGEYVFRHAIVRDVAYAAIPSRERRKTHLNVAKWIGSHQVGSVEEYALMAHHSEVGGDTEHAIKFNTLAGGASAGVRIKIEDGRFCENFQLFIQITPKIDPHILEKSKLFFEKAIDLALKSEKPDICANICATAGDLYYSIGRVTDAIPFFQRAIRYLEHSEDQNSKITYISKLASSFSSVGDFDSAKKVLSQIKSLQDDSLDPETRCNFARSIYLLCYSNNEMERGLGYLTEALKIAVKHDIKDQISAIAHNLSSSYFELGDYALAYKYLETSQICAKEICSDLVIFLNHILAAGLDALSNSDSDGLPKLHKYLEEAFETGNVWKQLNVNMVFGNVYVKKRNAEYARKHFENTLKIGKKHGNTFFETTAQTMINKLDAQ